MQPRHVWCFYSPVKVKILVTPCSYIRNILTTSRILGEILEYHFLCGSATFNQSADYLLSVRRNIEGNLGLWFISFQSLVEPDFAKLAEVQGEAPALREEPQIAYYALHLYHCMHILLYGPMDIVVMYEDLKWQASSEFVAACEHANACAKVSQPGTILHQLACPGLF